MKNAELPYINQSTIECDLRAFTRWLADLVDQVNWCTKVYSQLSDDVEDLKYEVNSLKNRMDNAETNITNLDSRLTSLESRVSVLEQSGEGGAIDALAGRVDLLYGWLPIPYGNINAKGWKFAMGNISVMSDNNGTPSIDGAGIYTSGSIEDNDIYMN